MYSSFMPVAIPVKFNVPVAIPMSSSGTVPPPPGPTQFFGQREHTASQHGSGRLVVGHAFQPYNRELGQRPVISFDESNDVDNETSTDMEDEPNDFCDSRTSISPLLNFHARPVLEPRPELDNLVGTSTSDIYLRMRATQNNHRPAFQPDSPYVKYRRYHPVE